MELRIQNSEKKRLVQEESHVREIEMKFLDKESSRQYSQVMEELMKTNLRKESHASMPRHKSKTSNDFDNLSNFKTTMPKPKDSRISEGSRESKKSKVKQEKESSKDKQGKQASEVRVDITEEESQEETVQKIPYKFSLKSWGLEMLVGYSVTFAVLYFIRAGSFPYFELILTIALTVAVQPWRFSNLLMLVGTFVVIGNHFLGLTAFTYPSIGIAYYSLLVFNQKHKRKQLFVLGALLLILFSFLLLPAISDGLKGQDKLTTYTYIFPLLMLAARTTLAYFYWLIDHTELIYLQLPLLLTGLDYGAVLSFGLDTIEFWYLLVAFSLQIVNDRTQFLLGLLTSVSCTPQRPPSRPHPILPPHASGYACLQSYHIFVLVYIYAALQLYSPPFSSAGGLDGLMNPGGKPVVVWVLTSVYQTMSVLLCKHRKDLLLFGFTSNKWWRSMLRGLVLALGMWAFYLGLAVAASTFSA